MIPYHIRPVARDTSGSVATTESGFVAGSWLRSYQSSAWARHLDIDSYRRWHAPIVSGLMDHCTVLVAEQEGTPGALLGHACAEVIEGRGILHYVYVKGDFRKLGIGRALWDAALEAAGYEGKGRVFYSHNRAPFSEWVTPLGWKFLPYPAMRWAQWRKIA